MSATPTGLAKGCAHSCARTLPHVGRYRVELANDWQDALSRWNDLGLATPFQDLRCLSAWYEFFTSDPAITALIAIVFDIATSELVIALPFVRHVQNGVRVIEFADLNLTDYNAPLLGPMAPYDLANSCELWRVLRRALRQVPGGADLIRLRKMPDQIGGRVNPLALLAQAGPCALNGNIVMTGDDFEAWRFTLERTVRKELKRSWRVFTREAQAGFEVVSNPTEALRLFSIMEIQQEFRMKSLGHNFSLNDTTTAAFYRRIVEQVVNGFAVVSALKDGNNIVATLLGIRSGDHYVMIRISNAGDRWSKCSPGRLIIERTMEVLHKDGVRYFDFSIGNYAYKRRFGVVVIDLVELSAAINWRGWPYLLHDRVALWLRRHPTIEKHVRRILRKQS